MKLLIIAIITIALATSQSFAGDLNGMVNASTSHNDVEARVVQSAHGKQAVVFDYDGIKSFNGQAKTMTALGVEVNQITLKDTTTFHGNSSNVFTNAVNNSNVHEAKSATVTQDGSIILGE